MARRQQSPIKKRHKHIAPAPAPILSTPISPPRPNPAELKIVFWPTPVLTHRAKPVEQIDDWLRQVSRRMMELMEKHKGVGLAGPQVGLPLRLFVMAETGKAADARAIINPVLDQQEGFEEAEEGCLSLPDIRGKITRYVKLRIQGLDIAGQPVVLHLEGFPARIVQHETDHLDGVLIIDRMAPLTRLAQRKALKALENAAAK